MSFSFTCFIFRSVFSKLRERCISSACCLTKHSLREDRFCLFYKVSFWLNSSSSSGGASVVPEVQIKKKKKAKWTIFGRFFIIPNETRIPCLSKPFPSFHSKFLRFIPNSPPWRLHTVVATLGLCHMGAQSLLKKRHPNTRRLVLGRQEG